MDNIQFSTEFDTKIIDAGFSNGVEMLYKSGEFLNIRFQKVITDSFRSWLLNYFHFGFIRHSDDKGIIVFSNIETIADLEKQKVKAGCFALIQVEKSGLERPILDAYVESPFEAYDILRKLSYGFQELGIRAEVLPVDGGQELNLTGPSGKEIKYTFIHQK
jgi:hypothetical protein